MTLQLTIQRERPIVDTSAVVQSRCGSLRMVKDVLDVQPITQTYNRSCNFTLSKANLTATPSEIVSQEVVDIYFGRIFRGLRGKSAYETAVEGGYDKSEVIFNRTLANIGKKSEEIADGAITTEKIYSRAVTGDKIALLAVKEEHIAEGAVTTTKIFSRAVTSKKIAEQAIIAEHIAPNTITEEHLSRELRDKINDDAGYVWAFKENETVAQVATTVTQTKTTVYTRI